MSTVLTRGMSLFVAWRAYSVSLPLLMRWLRSKYFLMSGIPITNIPGTRYASIPSPRTTPQRSKKAELQTMKARKQQPPFGSSATHSYLGGGLVAVLAQHFQANMYGYRNGKYASRHPSRPLPSPIRSSKTHEYLDRRKMEACDLIPLWGC
ncbi:hypothetical protein BJ878DRAFT_281524 [Calycina marina]|uniref:Uncharacterized protein n=1 Tax=Calycina marina TaxID=1763456 RepID=A0A9P8CH24_9HELO|nr:hypothetical protein BJ878DRAFT_281524 [Calycina marina]